MGFEVNGLIFFTKNWFNRWLNSMFYIQPTKTSQLATTNQSKPGLCLSQIKIILQGRRPQALAVPGARSAHQGTKMMTGHLMPVVFLDVLEVRKNVPTNSKIWSSKFVNRWSNFSKKDGQLQKMVTFFWTSWTKRNCSSASNGIATSSWVWWCWRPVPNRCDNMALATVVKKNTGQWVVWLTYICHCCFIEHILIGGLVDIICYILCHPGINKTWTTISFKPFFKNHPGMAGSNEFAKSVKLGPGGGLGGESHCFGPGGPPFVFGKRIVKKGRNQMVPSPLNWTKCF